MAVANARLPPPLLLGAAGTNCSKQWKDWLQQFEWYALVAELDKKAANVQVAIFMSAIGQDAINVFNTFPEDKRVDLKLLITEFNNYFTPKVNITYERFVFNQVIQVAGQKFDDFCTELLSKSQSCDFNTLRDSLVMDRIVIGVLHDSDRAHLLSVNELTLDKAVQFCRAAEQARVQLTSLKSDPVQVDVVRKKVHNSSQNSSSTKPCSRCGTKHAWKKCPAFQKVCHTCKRTGHYSRFCKAKQVSTLDSTGNIGAAGDFVVHEMSKGGSPELSWYEDLLFDNGCVVRAKLDTGAQCNVLSLHHAKQAGLKVRPSTEKRNKYKEHHDRGTKLQQPLSVGQEVLLRVKRRKWKPALIVSTGPTSRSYMVKMSDGRVFRRNSWFLRALHSQDATQSSSTQTTTSVAPMIRTCLVFRVSHRVLLTNLFPAFRLPVQGMKLVLRQDLEGQ
ncbi:hypothetical protein JTE90_009559 [Oedothorax gibbosus]|uniref:CCHC-type domain-containing protein n=1 Tax=Oedothorax gibbosus TaxID=931172 RepID=A0AAV6V0X0_9ARAC|nr:hypothetical protein JTE90_009559 [Oedothorax gibbosus]